MPFNGQPFRTNVLLMGPICTGKTWALTTFLDLGKTVLILATEPGVFDTIETKSCQHGYDLHVASVLPARIDWDDIESMADKIRQTIGGDAMQKLNDPNKRDYDQFMQVYAKLRNYQCELCGKSFGPVDKLDSSYAVAMDGLTGLSKMSMHMTAGLKPSKSWPEYDAAGQLIENLLSKCCADLEASFVLLAHIDREPDPLGGFKYTMHTIGNKLAPRLTKDLFSEIALSRREDTSKGPKFYWSTVSIGGGIYDLKARRLPFSDEIKPSFAEIFPKENDR